MRFPLVSVANCPDRGLEALYKINDFKLDIYAWMIVLVAFKQIYTLLLIS